MITILPVTTMEECRQIQEITVSAWGADLSMAVPDHLAITLAREKGGVVLMAWDGQRPVGFCMGFLSYVEHDRRLKHCSHMAGVIAEYRGNRVGEMLKWSQRDAVLEMGIDLITWTYDPLETLNGRLNIHKLGAICQRYKRDHYGEATDALSRGLPTDRFHVDWWITSPWVRSHKDGSYAAADIDQLLSGEGTIINTPIAVGDQWQVGKIDFLALTSDKPLVAVPRDFQGIKKAGFESATAWRIQTRTIFEHAFAKNLVVLDLLVKDRLCYYLLGSRDELFNEQV